MWRTEGREVKDAISSEESQVGIVKTKANRGEKPAPWSSLLSVPAGTTARCSWWPQPPYEAQTWHAGISSMLLAGGREAASFTGAFLLSAPCHHSTQLDLQISWFLDVALHHWWPILFCFLIFVTFYLWASETKKKKRGIYLRCTTQCFDVHKQCEMIAYGQFIQSVILRKETWL